MSGNDTRRATAPRPSLFIEGYLNDRFAAGDRPTYGYPPSPLPDARGHVMEVVSCWPGARPRKATRG